jgi:hypothetical protein
MFGEKEPHPLRILRGVLALRGILSWLLPSVRTPDA